MNDQRGSIGTKMWMPRPPEVFGNPVSPCSARISRTCGATRAASSKVVPGCGSRSIRSWSGASTSARVTGHGWKVSVPRFAAQATTASSVGVTSSAVRPDGNVIVVDST